MDEGHRSGGRPWGVVAAAAVLLAVTLGSRSTLGLFIGPINSSSAIGLAALGLGLGLAQLAFGAAQPLAAALALRFGPVPVIAGGGLASAAGLAALAALAAPGGVAPAMAALILVGAAGAAAGSTPLLMAAVAQRVPEDRRGIALGVVGAGGPAGQLLLALLCAALLPWLGWQSALLALAVLALAAAPLARLFRAGSAPTPRPPTATTELRAALRAPAFWQITLGYAACGFHVTFLTAHMPGVIAACGLPPALAGDWLAIMAVCNMAGSLAAGWLSQRLPLARLLAAIYALRAVGVALFLLLPARAETLLGLAVWMGLTAMATVAPTSGLIARLYGPHLLATLFGITMAVHQVGSFVGASAGGVDVALTGGYGWVWMADLLLATAAAALHLRIREKAVVKDAEPATAAATRSAPA